VRKRAEQGLVEQLIPQMADERLGKAFCAAPARYGATTRMRRSGR